MRLHTTLSGTTGPASWPLTSDVVSCADDDAVTIAPKSMNVGEEVPFVLDGVLCLATKDSNGHVRVYHHARGT